MPHDVIALVARRTALIDGAVAVSAGILVTVWLAAALLLTGRTGLVTGPIALLSGTIAAWLAWRRTAARRGPGAAAHAIEHVRPSGNVVITAEELQRFPERAPEWIRRRVEADASARLAGLDPSVVVPSRRAVSSLMLAMAALAALILIASTPGGMRPAIERVQQTATTLLSGRSATAVRVVIEPPAYAGAAAVTLDDPPRLEALEGSVIRFAVPGVSVRFGTGEQRDVFVARETGYFAVEAPSAPSRLIPLTVTPDHSPTVRVEDPGKDLLVPPGDRTVALKFSAADDLALEAMELRYTKVSGTGEQFEFQEGRLPIELERVNAREWRGRGRLSLASLGLEAGDSLVYRVVARDKRAGEAGLGTSDTYFVEVLGPGHAALEGIEMPPDMERYALSQQMIVLKLERLRARERTLTRDAIVEETASIAAEQRAVRANFIFLMGGHVEDEEVEAEQSHEIQEGRLENTARRDINTAISHMTRVEQRLAAVEITAALPPARLAVDALQRAFGRSRYILRSLAVRSRLDMSRRLTGNASSANNWRREPGSGEDEEASARDLFDRLVSAGRLLERGEALPSDGWQRLAEAALRIDPASALWVETSRSLLALQGADASTVHEGLERVLAVVSVHAQRESLPRTSLKAEERPLSRAWRAERR